MQIHKKKRKRIKLMNTLFSINIFFDLKKRQSAATDCVSKRQCVYVSIFIYTNVYGLRNLIIISYTHTRLLSYYKSPLLFGKERDEN